MTFSPFEKRGDKAKDDELFMELISAYVGRGNSILSNLANLSALIFWYLDDVSWCGFYLIEDGKLVLGPFQGLPACSEIRIGRGVCGTAYEQNRTLLVPDVSAFPGHIACASDTRSEVVVPLSGFGVLDLDSRTLDRFKDEDAALLERVMKYLEDEILN